MGSMFLLPCFLVLAAVGVTHQHKTETTTASLPRDHDDGGVLSLLIQQAVQLSSLKAEMTALKKNFNKAMKATKETEDNLRNNQGSTFVRWGRKSCPDGTTLAYSGYAAGKKHDRKGGGTNYLCLTKNPQFDNKVSVFSDSIYGTEYETPGPHYDHDMPCSVCRAPQSTTIMVPGTFTCPSGWTPQYNGHIVGQYVNHYATEYLCLDSNPEHVTGGHASRTESFVYNINVACGSLPCPPYVNGKDFTCVVCSK